MRFGIVYRGQDAGWVVVDADARGILFQAESTVHTSAVLRLYGLTQEGTPLRVGVLEPENGVLKLSRRMTKQTLHTAKIEQPPEQYYLDDGQPGCLPVGAVYGETKTAPETAPHTAAAQRSLTGDPLLQQVIRAGAASFAQEGNLRVIRAPFTPGRAHPLHFALTACAIEHTDDGSVAVLRQKHCDEDLDAGI